MLTGRISNKLGTKKGGQTVLVSDVHLIRPRAYWHIHKLHVKSPGWNVWVKIELKEIIEVLKLMVEGDEWDERMFYVNTHTQNVTITPVGII